LTVGDVDEWDIRYHNDSGLVQLRGTVAGDPEPAGGRVALRLESIEIDVEGEWKEVSGAALMYAPRVLAPDALPPDATRDPPRYLYGDRLRVEGEPATPPVLEDFDWRGYLDRQGVYSLIERPRTIELVDYWLGSPLQRWVHQARDRMSRSLEDAMHEPQASLAQALLLGDRSSVPDDLREDLSRTGTAHIIAISGLHIYIAGGAALSFGIWLFGRRRPYYLLLALGTIWAYALLSGMHAPVLRAGIMGSLWLVALYLGRPRSSLAWLAFAAAIMVAVKPGVLREVSFQMSFAAMAGIILLTPHIQSRGERLLGIDEGGRRWLGVIVSSFSITLGAVVAVAPVIAYYFGSVSLVALPANLFALPALPFAVGTSAVVAVIGIVVSPLAQVLGWLAWLFFGWIIGITGLFSSLPFAAVEVGEVSAAAVWVYYAILGGALWAGVNRSRSGVMIRKAGALAASLSARAGRVPAALVILPLGVIAALTWTAAVTAHDGRVHVFILDVGQGDAILVQKGSQQVLVDGGPDPDGICLELGETMPFWDRDIEMVISTHPHADHLAGLVEVMERFDVGVVLAGGGAGDTATYREWVRRLDTSDVEQVDACAGQTIDLGDGLLLEVLHPAEAPLDGTASDADNNSVVVRLVYGDFSLLLTGDIHRDAEGYLLDLPRTLDCTVLKVAHHGSRTSSGAGFLDEVSPQLAVLSLAGDNRYGHPHPGVLDRLGEEVGEDGIYLTSEHGTIEMITDGDRLWVRTER
jgi:competence protein ComEC